MAKQRFVSNFIYFINEMLSNLFVLLPSPVMYFKNRESEPNFMHNNFLMSRFFMSKLERGTNMVPPGQGLGIGSSRDKGDTRLAKELVEAGERREAFNLSQRAPVRLHRDIKYFEDLNFRARMSSARR